MSCGKRGMTWLGKYDLAAKMERPSGRQIMATIYSGIHLKLKSAKTPWEDKLKLARFAWISHQCFLPNKEQVLVDWVSRALTGYYSKKLQFGDEILEGLWIYLDDILHSKKLQKLIEKGKIITLHATIAQIINDRIEEHSSEGRLNASPSNLATVLSCCHGILTSPAFALIYSSKWELLVDLLCRLSVLLCSRLKPTEALRSTQLFDVLLLAFDLYLVTQRQQCNRCRVFLQVCSPLLQPFLLLRQRLCSRCWTGEDVAAVRQHLSKEVCQRIQTALQSGLFHTDLLNSYRQELLQDNRSQEKTASSSKDLVAPVETMLSKLTDASLFGLQLHSAVVAGSVPLLYRLSLEAYCREGNHLLCFHIFARFLGTLGFPTPLDRGAGQEPAGWNPGLLALDQLLNSILGSDVYNVAVDKIRCGGVQFALYCRVAVMLLSHPRQEAPAWFRCLRTLILLNHLIVEPNLDDLVSLAWVDADISDPRVRRAQESLLCTLFETYTKLRQLPRLFQEVLAIISRPAADELRRPVLWVGLTEKLHECLLKLPSGQALDIWDLMLNCLEAFIPDLTGNVDTALKALAVSTLLNAVLFNMKSLDDKTPVPIITRTQRLMDKTMRAVVPPLFRVVKDPSGKDSSPWALRAESSVLILRSTWLELDHMLRLNCSKYVSPGGAEAEVWSLGSGLPREGWNDALSRHFLQLLAIQEMKSVMMRPGSRTEAQEMSLRSAAVSVVQSGKDAVKNAGAQAWDGEISSIDDETYAVAHWHLVTSNIALLLPHLPEPEIAHLADVVTANLLLREAAEQDQDSENQVSIPAMCRSLLRSSLLPEMPPLHHGVLLRLMEGVSDLLPDTRFNLPTCLLSDDVDASQEADNQQSSVSESLGSQPMSPQRSSLLNIPNVLLVKSPSTHTFSETQLDHLLWVLDLLGGLRLDSLPCYDHLRCFVLLASLVTALKPKPEKANASKCLQALSRSYSLLAVLQTGTSRNAVFKLAHAGDILEKVTASLFPAGSRLASCAECPAWPEFLDAVQRFLTVSIQTIVERKQSMRLNLEQFIAFLSNAWLSSARSKKWRPATEQLLITALSALSRVVIQAPLQPDKHTGNSLHSLLTQLAGLLGPVLQSHSDRDGRLEQNLTVFGITALLEIELCLREEEEGGADREDGSVVHERGSGGTQSLKHADLYQRTCFQVLRRLPSFPDDPESLQKQLDFLRIYSSTSELCSGCDNETGIPSVLSALKALLAAPRVTQQFIHSLEIHLVELLHCFIDRCTQQQFYLIVKFIAQGLEVTNLWKGQHQDVVSSLNLTALLLKCPLSGDVEKALWFIAPQIIMALTVLCKEAALDQAAGFRITVLSLETLAILVQQGEGILSNPHHVTLAFNALLCVPLDHFQLDEYGSIFRTIQEVLFAIVQSQTKVLFNAAPTFFKCFNRLVLSVMHKGRQKCVGDKGVTKISDVVLECAHLVERMCTHIASNAEKFAMFSSFAVAEYVNELQKVTLNTDVKRHLTVGIYHLLDLVTESDLRFLNTSLQTGVREVFKELYNDYTHYHKSKKQGEEKYTA